NGEPGERTEYQAKPLAAVRGAAFLFGSEGSPEALRVKALERLANAPPAPELPAKDSDEVHSLFKRMQDGFASAAKMQAVLEHARTFLAADNLSALQTWTSHADSGSPVRFITLDGRPRISIYRRVNSKIAGAGFRDVPDVVTFDETLRAPLRTLPLL